MFGFFKEKIENFKQAVSNTAQNLVENVLSNVDQTQEEYSPFALDDIEDTLIGADLGVGYAASKTTLKLADIYGDLSTDSDLQNYGTPDADGVIQFTPPSDKSKYPTSENVAGIAALGISYGIAEYTFIDLGARVIYIPKITWNLVNADGSLHREWFSAKNMIYSNFTVGLRFEF